MKFLHLILFFLISVALASAQDVRTDIKFGDRPKSSIFDPEGFLSVKQQQSIAEPLRKILSEENIDIIVVILPEISDKPPEDVARGFAERWSEKKLNSVVLHVPEDPDSPWIFPGEVMSTLIKPEILDRDISQAQKRAAAEPEDFGKVRAASIEAADLLRYWTGGAMLVLEQRSNANFKAYLAREQKRNLFKLAGLFAAGAIIPVTALLVWLFRAARKNKPLEFPKTRKIARLGAPYSGGNHASSKEI
ncbi:MAG: TPM domain-containing protein [Luteolibacter sp.]